MAQKNELRGHDNNHSGVMLSMISLAIVNLKLPEVRSGSILQECLYLTSEQPYLGLSRILDSKSSRSDNLGVT
jgi:hypothetical protein